MLRIKILALVFFSSNIGTCFYAERIPLALCKNVLATEIIFPDSRATIKFSSADTAYFEAKLALDGTVTFDFKNRDSKNEILNSDLIPKEAFQGVITHWGPKVRAIRGVWMKAPQGYGKEVSRNFYEFQEALERGLSPEEAVFETWTGKQAKAAGFSKCLNIQYVFENDENPKNAWKLYVDFGR